MKNRVYIGEARSGTYRLPGAHEPIVERGIFELVQSVRSATAPKSGGPLVLAGLLRCAGCGKSVGTTLVRRSNDEPRPRYSCRGRSSTGLCPAPVSYRGTEIEDLVERAFFDLYENSPLRRGASAETRSKADEALGCAELALAEFDRREESRSEDRERALLARDLEAARTRAADLARSTLLESPALLRRRWPRLPPLERRRIMGLMLDAVLMRPDRGEGLPDRLLLVPFGMGRDGLPRPMRPSARFSYEWSTGACRGPVAVLGPEDPSPSFC